MNFSIMSDQEINWVINELIVQWNFLRESVVGVLNGDDFDLGEFTKLASDTHACLLELSERFGEDMDLYQTYAELHSEICAFHERAYLYDDVPVEFKAACLIAEDLTDIVATGRYSEFDKITRLIDEDVYDYDYTERDITQLREYIARLEAKKSLMDCVYPSLRKDTVFDKVYHIGYRFKKDASDEQKTAFCTYVKSDEFMEKSAVLLNAPQWSYYPNEQIVQAFERIYSKRYIKHLSGSIIRMFDDSQLNYRVLSLFEGIPKRLLMCLNSERFQHYFEDVERDDKIEIDLRSTESDAVRCLMALARSEVIFIVADEEQSESRIHETIGKVRILNPNREIYVCRYIESFQTVSDVDDYSDCKNIPG